MKHLQAEFTLATANSSIRSGSALSLPGTYGMAAGMRAAYREMGPWAELSGSRRAAGGHGLEAGVLYFATRADFQNQSKELQLSGPSAGKAQIIFHPVQRDEQHWKNIPPRRS